MAEGTTNLIELTHDKDGVTYLRVHKGLWTLIRGASDSSAIDEDSHFRVKCERGSFGVDDEIAFPMWGPVDMDCRCAPVANT